MSRLFGIIDINSLKIAEKSVAGARGFFDYFAGVNIDNPSKLNINDAVNEVVQGIVTCDLSIDAMTIAK